MIDRPRSHVLACVWANGQADRIVAHAQHLASALGSHWTVLNLQGEVPAAADAQPAKAAHGGGQADLHTALQAAVLAGAQVLHQPSANALARRQPAALISQVAASAQALNATTLLISPPPRSRASTRWSALWTEPFAAGLRRALVGVHIHLIDAGAAAGDSPAWAKAVKGAPTALAVLGGCTAIGWLLRPHIEPANLITVFLAGIVYVALKLGRPMALLTVVGSIFLYDLLFIVPNGSAEPGQRHYWLVSTGMLLMGTLVSHLASRSREQTAVAEARAERAQALNHLALELVKARSPDSIGAALALAVYRTLGASAKLLQANSEGQLDNATGCSPPLRRLARHALALRCETGAGTAFEPESTCRCLPLLAADGPLGVVGVDLLDSSHDTPEDRELLKAFANQTALALDRAVFEKRSAQIAVQAEGERLRNTLLAGVSHDFRTPLTTIVGAATTLLEQGHVIAPLQHQALLGSVLNEARRLHALSSNLLDLTRMQEGAILPKLEWCPADELVDEARSALAARLDSHEVSVTAAPDAVVWCDPRLVGQVLVNLLENAIRHAPGSQIMIAVNVTANRWQLVVEDNGPGVPAGDETDVFKKFFRGRSDTESSGGGTGLGLAICAAVAKLHGGTLTVSSGRGARFELNLPQPVLSVVGLRELE